MRRGRFGLATVLLLVACTQHHQAPAATRATLSPVSLPACAPRSGYRDELPDGTATGKVADHRVTRTFDFTRDLTIAPPPPSVRPAVTEAQAECQLRSAVGLGGVEPGRVALATVTLRGLQAAAGPSYRNRVAWILISYSADVVPSCAARVAPSPSSAAASPPPPEWPTPRGGPEQIIAIDATTGASALYYDEHYTCQGDPPAPTAGVPLQVQSVRWTLVSRTGTTLTLRAGWPACEAFAANQDVPPPPGFDAMSLTKQERVSGVIPVRVWRPLGPQCAPDVSHDITVTSDLATKSLPATLHHAPLGLESG